MWYEAQSMAMIELGFSRKFMTQMLETRDIIFTNYCYIVTSIANFTHDDLASFISFYGFGDCVLFYDRHGVKVILA